MANQRHKAFAEELDCKFVEVKTKISSDINLQNIKAAAKEAKERFEQDRTRTIILLDEFESFANIDNKKNQELKEFIENISKEYHCTIFATTNHPTKINQDMVRGKLFYKVGLAPANKENSMEILKHYISEFADESVNFETIATELVKPQPNAAFSNSRIEKMMESLVKNENNIGKKLTQMDIIQIIDNQSPDINIKDIHKFHNDFSFCKILTENPDVEIIRVPLVNTQKKQILDDRLELKLELQANKYAQQFNLLDKKDLIKNSLNDLKHINDDEILEGIFNLLTHENREFLTQKAVPTVLRNSEILDLEYTIVNTLKHVNENGPNISQKALSIFEEQLKYIKRI